MRHLKTAKLAAWQIRLLIISGAMLWLSGISWLWLHYFGQKQGEFGPEVSPIEPWMLRLHGAAMVAMLLGGGSLLVVHVWRGWQYRPQRILGLALTIVLCVLIVTGYLLYYVADEDWRSWISIVHWGIGIVSILVFVLHYMRGRSMKTRHAE